MLSLKISHVRKTNATFLLKAISTRHALVLSRKRNVAELLVWKLQEMRGKINALGLMTSRVPEGDLASRCVSSCDDMTCFQVDRRPVWNSTFDAQATESIPMKEIFTRKVHVFSNSISGYMNCQMVVLMYLMQEHGELPVSNLRVYLHSVLSLALFASGGHSYFEYLYTIKLFSNPAMVHDLFGGPALDPHLTSRNEQFLKFLNPDEGMYDLDTIITESDTFQDVSKAFDQVVIATLSFFEQAHSHAGVHKLPLASRAGQLLCSRCDLQSDRLKSRRRLKPSLPLRTVLTQSSSFPPSSFRTLPGKSNSHSTWGRKS